MARILIAAGFSPVPEAMIKQAQTYTGPIDGCFWAQGKNADEFADEFRRILEKHKGDEFVILCDAMQSKANEAALLAMRRYDCHGAVMVGMNLGMVVNAMLLKDETDSADQLIEALTAQAKSSIGGMNV
mgnify:CR=1 FL=1